MLGINVFYYWGVAQVRYQFRLKKGKIWGKNKWRKVLFSYGDDICYDYLFEYVVAKYTFQIDQMIWGWFSCGMYET